MKKILIMITILSSLSLYGCGGGSSSSAVAGGGVGTPSGLR
jgi:hypothetical protein